MGDQEFSTVPQAKDWLGYLVGQVIGMETVSVGGRKHVQDIIGVWVKAGVIVEVERWNEKGSGCRRRTAAGVVIVARRSLENETAELRRTRGRRPPRSPLSNKERGGTATGLRSRYPETAQTGEKRTMAASRFFAVGGPARLDKPASRTWASETASWLAGRSSLDEADALGIQLERKWGLRATPAPRLDRAAGALRQPAWKLAQAQWHGGLDDVIREAGRMARAWRALDAAAEAAGAAPLSPEVWELSLSDGRVVALTRSRAEAHHVVDDPRFVATYTLSDVAGLDRKARLLFRRRTQA